VDRKVENGPCWGVLFNDSVSPYNYVALAIYE
jgi:hypothetical protein